MEQKLTLYPDTFIWRKNDKGLIYNAQNGNVHKFDMSNSIGTLCSRFEDMHNLYSILIDMDFVDDPAREFIKTIVTNEFGFIAETGSMCISLPPLLNLQHQLEKLKTNKDHAVEDNVLKYLSTLTIYMGGICNSKPYFQQIVYPVHSDKPMTIESIVDFLKVVATPSLFTINIVVSNVDDIDVSRISEALNPYKAQILFYFLHTNKDTNDAPYKLVEIGYKVRFICEITNESIGLAMRDIISKNLKEPRSLGYDFIVKNDSELQFWSELVDELELNDYEMIPVYDDNDEFFSNHVFLDEADIIGFHISRREVFSHQTLNTNEFGRLTVMPDGKVYSDVSASPLGTIENSIYDLIIRELEQNYAWRKIRDTVICKQCLYQWLCPSPFRYERIAGKETGCNFK